MICHLEREQDLQGKVQAQVEDSEKEADMGAWADHVLEQGRAATAFAHPVEQ